MVTAAEIATFDLAAAPMEFIRDPFPYYDALLAHAPVLAQPDGSFIISRHADLHGIYRDTTRYLSDKKVPFGAKYGVQSMLYEHHTTSLVFNDPPLHTRVRTQMVTALNARAIAAMEPGLIRIVDGMLDALAEQDEVDLIEDFASRIPIQVIGNLFDIPMSERGPLRDWSIAILSALEPTLTPEQEAAGNAAVAEFKAYLRDLTNDRRRNPGDPDTDVLSRLIAAEGDNALTEVELLQNCIFILNAGHETTTNLIGNALWVLQENPRELARIKADEGVLKTGVDEFLRYLSPNQFGNRTTAEPVQIGGVNIPEGTNLHLCIGAANRDPARFEDPNKLDLTRKPNPHLAFAGGAHLCVGFTLARMEGRIAIGRFINRFPDYRLTGSPTIGGRIRFRGFANLPARLAA